jgi:hypothetical protein
LSELLEVPEAKTASLDLLMRLLMPSTIHPVGPAFAEIVDGAGISPEKHLKTGLQKEVIQGLVAPSPRLPGGIGIKNLLG